MPRVKRGVTSHAKHKKVLQMVEGHRGTRRRLIKKARESAIHAMTYAFRDRRNRKRVVYGLYVSTRLLVCMVSAIADL